MREEEVEEHAPRQYIRTRGHVFEVQRHKFQPLGSASKYRSDWKQRSLQLEVLVVSMLKAHCGHMIFTEE